MAHDGNRIRHRQSLFLVVGDKDEGGAELTPQLETTCICCRSLRSSAPSGSSRRRTDGRLTNARARATRCCWPPESSLGLRSAKLSISTMSRASPTRFRRSAAGPRPAQPVGDILGSVHAGTGRSSGTPCSRRVGRVRAWSRHDRRSGPCRNPAARNRRSCAEWSTCRREAQAAR